MMDRDVPRIAVFDAALWIFTILLALIALILITGAVLLFYGLATGAH